jgi:BNR repeat-containing family member
LKHALLFLFSLIVFQSYSQNLSPNKQWQYAAYYDTTGHVVLAKRKPGSNNWEVKQTALTGNTRDAHNTISIILDGDGYLHVSWDHHNNALNYCRSVAPGSLELTPKQSMTGKEESSVTYPEFYKMPNGDLLLLYRDGSSGRGNLVLNRYYTKTKTWQRIQNNLIDGEGQRSPYWQACVDDKGAFHISWVWRESPDVASNHDLCYARSTDGGKTWQQSTGQQQAIPMNAANAEYIVRIPQRSDLINSTSMCANANGHPYIATYWKPAGEVSAQYHLVFYDGKAWQVTQVSHRTDSFSLSGQGTKRIPISRPQVLIDQKRIFVFFRDAARGNVISVYYIPEISGPNNFTWSVKDLTQQPVGQWEPSYDTELWRRYKTVNLFVQFNGQGDGERTEKIPAQLVSILQWLP